MTDIKVFSNHKCKLGEGIIYNPVLNAIFWVDIMTSELFMKTIDGNEDKSWKLDIRLSAVFSHDNQRVLLCAGGNIYLFNIYKETTRLFYEAIELDDGLRCNDARVDPKGNIWFSTMHENADKGKGAIYRIYNNTVEAIIENLTIPNAICFDNNLSHFYYTDSFEKIIYRVPINSLGNINMSEKNVFINLSNETYVPDGAVIDHNGYFWNAQWDGYRVTQYSADGDKMNTYKLPVKKPTCLVIHNHIVYVSSASVIDAGEKLSDLDGKVLQFNIG